jgi:hypothetical protein
MTENNTVQIKAGFFRAANHIVPVQSKTDVNYMILIKFLLGKNDDAH